MLVLVQDAAEAVASSYVEPGDSAWIGERRAAAKWARVGDALMEPVFVVELLELRATIQPGCYTRP